MAYGPDIAVDRILFAGNYQAVSEMRFMYCRMTMHEWQNAYKTGEIPERCYSSNCLRRLAPFSIFDPEGSYFVTLTPQRTRTREGVHYLAQYGHEVEVVVDLRNVCMPRWSVDGQGMPCVTESIPITACPKAYSYDCLLYTSPSPRDRG